MAWRKRSVGIIALFVNRYSGAVCHTSLNFMSCVQYHNSYPDSQYAETIIDIDGSGPLAPFPGVNVIKLFTAVSYDFSE